MDDPSLSRRSSFTGHVPRLQCVRFPLFESVSRLDVRITDHGHVVGVCLVCASPRSWPSLFLAVCILPRVPSHTSFPCCSCQPRKDKTPSQIGQTSLSWHRGHPSRMRDVPHLSWMCSRRLSSHGAWVFSLTSVPITSTVRLLSSSLVFSRLLSSSFVSVGGFVCKRSVSCSVSPRERPSSRATRTLGCPSESVPASTGQQLMYPTCQ